MATTWSKETKRWPIGNIQSGWVGRGGGNHITSRVKLEVYDIELFYLKYTCYDSCDLNTTMLKMQLLIQVDCWMICLG